MIATVIPAKSLDKGPRLRTSVRYRDFQPHPTDCRAVQELEGIVSGFSVSPRGRVYGVHCNREFADCHVPVLLAMPGLIEVTVTQCSNFTPLFTDVGFCALMAHPSLFGFGCASNQCLGNDIANAAASSQSLRRLMIPSCPMTDVGVQQLAQHSKLQALNLNDSGISDCCVPDLCRLTELRRLDVRFTSISEQSLELLSSTLTKCHTLLPRPS